jgi:hypothetical protein
MKKESEAVSFYHSLGRFGVQPGLERIRALCARLGDPQETMLAFALGLIEGRTRSAENAASPALSPVSDGFHPRTTGVFVGRY